jgi:hypothetical protein
MEKHYGKQNQYDLANSFVIEPTAYFVTCHYTNLYANTNGYPIQQVLQAPLQAWF